MKRILNIFAILIVTSFSITSYSAKNQCSSLFSQGLEAPKTTIEYFLSPEALAENQLILKEKKLYDLKNLTNGEPTFIGNVIIREEPNLYQWGPIADQKIQMGKNNGITVNEMTYILTQGPQVYGRGFYVSTHPQDSSSYGDGLTVFKTNGPMILLSGRIHVTDNNSSKVANLYQRLSSAGVDGIQGTPTWLSMISVKHLRAAKQGDITDPYWENLNNIALTISIANKLELSNFWKLLPESAAIKKVLSGDTAINPDLMPKIISELYLYHGVLETPIGRKIINAINQYLDNIDFLKITKKDLQTVLMNLRSFDILKSAKLNSSGYGGLMRYIDLSVINRALNGNMKKSEPDFQDMLSFVKETELNRSRVRLNTITTKDDFIDQVSLLVGEQIQIRDYDVMMSTHSRMSINVPPHRKEFLEKNPFLQATFQKPRRNGSVDAQVDYLTLEKIYGILDHLPLKSKTKAEMLSVRAKVLSHRNAELYQATYKKALAEILEAFFTTAGQKKLVAAANRLSPRFMLNEVTPENLYQIFISIHPFQEANGRAGRLYYEYITKALTGVRQELILFNYDIDLLTNSKFLKNQSNLSDLLMRALDQAKTREELREIIQKILEVYKEMGYT
ncbi:MAG: Fic family protein [Bdellovibrionota bacterium]